MRLPKPAIRKARIEIIPMIDTIFFLLVFFMFSSLSMVKLRGLAVNLPRPAPAAAKTPPKLVVTVTKSGGYSIGMSPTTLARLQADLQQRILAAPNTVIIVNVDGARPVQTLISVMDAVNGVTQTGRPDGPPAAMMIAAQPVNADGTAQ